MSASTRLVFGATFAFMVAACGDDTVELRLGQEESAGIFMGIVSPWEDTMATIVHNSRDSTVFTCPKGGRATTEGRSGEEIERGDSVLYEWAWTLKPAGCRVSTEGQLFSVHGNPNSRFELTFVKVRGQSQSLIFVRNRETFEQTRGSQTRKAVRIEVTEGDREGASPGWQPRGPVPEGAGGAEDGDHPPDDAGEAPGRDALVVPVDGEGGGHDTQLREHGVALGGADAPSVAHLQGEHGSALRGEAARRCGAVP